MTPFGKAFYQGKAIGYDVITLPFVILYNILWQVICSIYSNCSVVASVSVVFFLYNYRDPASVEAPPALLYFQIFCIFSPLNVLIIMLSIVIDVGGKWLIIGRRTKGIYSWEFSSYCQRWQAYLTVQKIHQGFLTLVHGSEFLCMYFRSLGATIGEEVCLYPNGGDPMMTEPELVTIGDYTSIDDASVIAHINTRGVFKLNPLNIGNRCVLKSNCRLLSGASMEDGSILLEHTLVLAGESADSNTVWQGWPSDVQMDLHDYQAHIKSNIDEAIIADIDSLHYSDTIRTSTSRSSNMELEKQSLLDGSSSRYNTTTGKDEQGGSGSPSSGSGNSKLGYSSIRDTEKTTRCFNGLTLCGDNV